MTAYNITCTEQTGGTPHGHIIAVGLLNQPRATGRFTVRDIYALMDADHVFYTVDPYNGKVALVHKYTCSCGIKTLRSAPDCTVHNNLDNLTICSWAA